MPFNHQTARLGAGRHDSRDHGACAMELASILAGERFSDRPRALSRALAAMLRSVNDGLDDERRRSPKPFAAASIGTAGDRAAERRRRGLVRAWLMEEERAGRRFARPRCLLGSIDLVHTGTPAALRVRACDDSALHARMITLLESMIAVTPAGAVPAAPPAPGAPPRSLQPR
jgi:hypothetical protein